MNGHRNTIPAVIRSHEGTAPTFSDAFIERIGVVFTEQTFVEVARCGIAPVLITIGEEMLHQCAGFPVACIITLQTLHQRHSKLPYEIRVFAIALFRTAPSWIAGQVGIGRKHHETFPAGDISLRIPTDLLCLNLSDTLYERAVPRTPHAIGLWEDGSGQVVRYFLAIDGLHTIVARWTAKRQSVQALVATSDRHSQTRRPQHGRHPRHLFVERQVLQKEFYTFVVFQFCVLKVIRLGTCCGFAEQHGNSNEK